MRSIGRFEAGRLLPGAMAMVAIVAVSCLVRSNPIDVKPPSAFGPLFDFWGDE